MIRIALTKENQKRTKPLQKGIIYKEDLSNNPQYYFQISPPDDAQYANISADRRSEERSKKKQQ
jgi:hypothetical protein